MAKARWNPFGASHPAPATTSELKAQPVTASSADGKQFGLENFGNTCYANSVLQALYFCGPFRELIIQSVDPSVPDVPPESSPLLTPVLSPPPAPTIRRRPERQGSFVGTAPDILPVNGSSLSTGPPIPPSPPTLFSALRSLFVHISRNTADKGTVSPRAFIDKLKESNELFRGTMHQDAHEFLNYLLNKIVEEIEEDRKRQYPGTPVVDDLSNSIGTLSSRLPPAGNASSSSATSPHDVTLVHRLFEGILTSETRCLTCETVSSRDESFLDLSIDIEQNSSVTACLRQFSASEMLCQKNKFFCDSCCDLQEAEKRMKVKKLPNILALHLKRFKYQEDLQKYIKLAYRVAFPLELRLFNTVDDVQDPDRLYELFSIVVHIGNGPHHGHYVTIIKTRGQWLVFDDDTVDPIKESDVPKYFGDSNSGSAYVLYYQAVDLDLQGLGVQRAPSPSQMQSQSNVIPSDSSQLSVPPLPPGLVKGDDSSDLSDRSSPITPSSSQRSPSIPVGEPPKPPPQPSLTLKVPSQDDGSSSTPSIAPSSPMNGSMHSGADSKSGLWHTLRHSPSAKIRGTFSADHRRSVTEKTSRPATMVGAVIDGDGPNAFNSVSNGKEKIKEPEKRTSGWFKLRGTKSRPSTAYGNSTHAPPLSPFEDEEPPLPSNISDTEQQPSLTNGHAPSITPSMTASHGSIPPDFRPPSFDNGTRSHDSASGYESYPGSDLTSPSRTLIRPPPDSPLSRSLSPPKDIFPSGSMRHPPDHPDNKKTLSRMSSIGSKRHKNIDPHTSSMKMARPATAIPSSSVLSSSPVPVPPLPPVPAVLSQPSPAVRDSVIGLGLKEPEPYDRRRPKTATAVADASTKRASRKMSFTSSLAMFSKKERQKDRELPPTSYPGL